MQCNVYLFDCKVLIHFFCYRYLRRTFQAAYYHHKPDVVVYLGDLLDEGSKASNSEYETYTSRFKDIFRTSEKTQVDICDKIMSVLGNVHVIQCKCEFQITVIIFQIELNFFTFDLGLIFVFVIDPVVMHFIFSTYI